MKKFIAFFLLLSFTGPAQAEYRVFRLQIKSPDGQLVREMKSTLDPDQYLGYYVIPAGFTITYSETWRCKGNTSHQDFCKSPAEIAAETPAAASPPP